MTWSTVEPLPLARYYEIDFAGRRNQYQLYRRCEAYVVEGIEWLLSEGETACAGELNHWRRHRGGFVCRHMPYRLALSMGEYRSLVKALRRGSGTPPGYTFVRRYGRWVE